MALNKTVKLVIFKKQMPLYLMLLPAVLFVVIFNYIPMAGIIIAFQKFIPAKGLFGNQAWIGLANFVKLTKYPDIYQVLYNTVFIAFLKICFGFIVPIVIAVLLNEVKNGYVKRVIQTSIYLPFFLSWVVLGGILIDILSPHNGIINNVLVKFFNIEPVFFLGENAWFPFALTVTHVWKEAGFGTVIFLAAITNIDPQQYESATIDGANRWQRIRFITLPGMKMVIVLIGVLSLGNILNAGFDQVFNLYNPVVYRSGDILDTFVYRLGIVQAQYSVATAIGLFKSVVSCIIISLSYFLAYRYTDYRIF